MNAAGDGGRDAAHRLRPYLARRPEPYLGMDTQARARDARITECAPFKDSRNGRVSRYLTSVKSGPAHSPVRPPNASILMGGGAGKWASSVTLKNA